MISAQAALQRRVRPGSWLPGVRNFHSEKQQWTFQVSAGAAIDAVWAAAGELRSEGYRQFEQNKAENTMTIGYVTRAGWLDLLRFSFSGAADGCVCEVEGCSSGVLPLSVPFAPLINIALCWLPFGDGGKVSQELRHLLEATAGKAGKVVPKTLRFSKTNQNRDKQAAYEASLQAAASTTDGSKGGAAASEADVDVQA